MLCLTLNKIIELVCVSSILYFSSSVVSVTRFADSLKSVFTPVIQTDIGFALGGIRPVVNRLYVSHWASREYKKKKISIFRLW